MIATILDSRKQQQEPPRKRKRSIAPEDDPQNYKDVNVRRETDPSDEDDPRHYPQG